MLAATRSPTVVAIIWTYNRFTVAERCVRAVLDQTRPADRVIVVDIASPDHTGSRLRAAYPRVDVIELASNDGPGAAIAAGLERAAEDDADYFWLVEDDSMPSTDCLEMALEKASGIQNLGILGPVGCQLRWGQWHATSELPAGAVRHVDFVVLDGALLSGDAVRRLGAPKTDYFIMMVDVEYPLRIARHGFKMVQAGIPYQQLRLGSAAADSTWRHYYQTRNHLRMAIDMRSPRLLVGFCLRTLKHFGYALRHGDRASARYRWHGIIDALLGRKGRNLEPPAD